MKQVFLRETSNFILIDSPAISAWLEVDSPAIIHSAPMLSIEQSLSGKNSATIRSQ
jgi:hypothetical protein